MRGAIDGCSLLVSTPDTVSTLAHYTSPELIVPELRARGTAAVIGELCTAMQREGRLEDPLAFSKAVMSHELRCSTAMPPGWALPHARVKGLTRLSFALGRSPVDLDWLEQGGLGVRMVFLFAVPDPDNGAYMSLLAALAKLGLNPTCLARLLQAPDRWAMLELLRQAPLPQTKPTMA